MVAEAAKHNLPAQLSSFIGREREIAEVERLLASTRLLTLVGSGGAGKTRLALRVAAEVAAEYTDGVWLVELAALLDASLLEQAVAGALGLRGAPGRPLLGTLADYLRPKSLLLVLDNCEHLVAACAQLTERLLRACPELRVLATSREGLGIAGETTWRVPSLSTPDLRHVPSPDGLTQYEAVRLFIDRARSALPTFSVTNENAPAVAQICHRLDGIPLAIELAAARVKSLPAEQIAARLDDRFRLLAGGSRTALPRQQTLRACIDWSHELLGAPERALLRRLSVFAGGWTLNAAEEVCSGGVIEAEAVLDLLTGLVDKSLTLAEENGGEGRYRLLETVRQYAADRLSESDEPGPVRDRHLDYFLDLAEESERAIRVGEDSQWLARLETEHDNLRAAFQWSLRGEGAESSLRLAAALYWFWVWRSRRSEGRQWLEGALSHSDSGTPRASRFRAKALVAAGRLAGEQGDFPGSGSAIEEGLDIARRLGDRAVMADALFALAFKANGEGAHERAEALYDESRALQRELGDRFGEARALHFRSVATRLKGDLDGAEATVLEGLAVSREIPSQIGRARALVALGMIAALRGDNVRAAPILSEALTDYSELGDELMIAYVLTCLGGISASMGNAEVAARLFGASEGAPDNGFLGFMPPDIRTVTERGKGAAVAALGEEAFAIALAEGRAMWPERAIAFALALPNPPADSDAKVPLSLAPSPPEHPAGLTGREVEVLRLVAGGLTSAQVAEKLVISTVTVSAHLRNIYAKLGVNTRSAATRWAIENGLA